MKMNILKSKKEVEEKKEKSGIEIVETNIESKEKVRNTASVDLYPSHANHIYFVPFKQTTSFSLLFGMCVTVEHYHSLCYMREYIYMYRARIRERISSIVVMITDFHRFTFSHIW